jgi:tRNA pseudouridine65 synthase
MEILFEDEALLAINKPAGLLVHPLEQGLVPRAEREETCLSLLRAQTGQHLFPVHRLDRATSGVLLFAKSSAAARALCGQFELGSVQKRYSALVRGWMEEPNDCHHPVWNEIRTERLPAQTLLIPAERFEIAVPSKQHSTSRFTLVECQPRSGRYHQIRQHLKHLHHPIVGDTSHGDGFQNRLFRTVFGFHRLFLHAVELCAMHPLTQERITLTAPLPDELAALLLQLRSSQSDLHPQADR